ncbi:MAG: hypothetical protein ACJ76Y_12010 [Thermoanaerobaculia bacterium]
MRRNSRVLWSILCALALAAPLAGQDRPAARRIPPIVHGVDVFQTSASQPTSVDFAPQPIPAGFFCPGSAPFNGQVQLKGVPLETAPPGVLGAGDTVVERLKDGIFSGGTATIPVQVRALQLTSVKPLSISCKSGPTDWKVDVCLCDKQPVTKIVAKVDQPCGCGHFDGELVLETCLRFTDTATGKVTGPIKQEVRLKIAAMPWCPKPVPNTLAIGPFRVRSCGGQGEKPLPGTSAFSPGWTCAEQVPGVDCWTKYASLTHCHQGPTPDHPHCVNPVCGKRG